VEPDKKKSFSMSFRSIGMLSAGSILSQLIIFIVTISVAKIYSPEKFGSYAVIISFANLVAPFLTFSKETFIVPEKSNQRALLLLQSIRRTFCLNLSILIIFVCMFLTQKYRLSFLQNVTTSEVLFSILLAGLFATHLIFQQIFLRNEHFNLIAMRGPIQNFGIGAYQVFFGLNRISMNGLIIGEILGRITSIGIYLRHVRRIAKKWRTELPIISAVQENTKNNYFVNFISILFDLFCVSLPLIASSVFYGNYYSGQVNMSLRIASIPTILIGSAFSQYILATGSSSYRESGSMTSESFNSILKRLIPISFLFSIFLFIVGKWGVIPILGEQWGPSGDILKLLTPMIFIGLIWAPLSSLFYVNHMWVSFLKVTVLRLCLMLTAVLLSQLMDFSFQGMIILIFVSSTVAQVVGLHKLLRTFN